MHWNQLALMKQIGCTRMASQPFICDTMVYSGGLNDDLEAQFTEMVSTPDTKPSIATTASEWHNTFNSNFQVTPEVSNASS